ncbi:MAG: HPP family protein [Nitrososphaera sp.]|jgi:CBS-domain-containing membrane protein
MSALKALACLLGRYVVKMRRPGDGNAAIRISVRAQTSQSLVSLLGAFIGICAIGYIALHFSLPFLLAPFGASVVLLFSVYDSPLAQPRNTILGHALAALIGGIIAIAHGAYFGSIIPSSESYVWIAASVALSIAAMQFLRLTHPPAGATAFIAATSVSNAESFGTFMVPVVAGAAILVGIAVAFNNAIPSRKYPTYW